MLWDLGSCMVRSDFLRLTLLCFCLLVLRVHGYVEDPIFHRLNYKVSLKREKIRKRNATLPHEFIYKRNNEYFCTVNALKEYKEYMEGGEVMPEVPEVSADSFNAYLASLKGQCLIYFDLNEKDSAYQICFSRAVNVFKYLDSEMLVMKNIYIYQNETAYTDEVLNYKSKSRSAIEWNNFHTQTYLGFPCPYSLSLHYEAKINFYCNHNVEGMFICKAKQIGMCTLEITVYDSRLCDIPLFQPKFKFSKSSKLIECYLMDDDSDEIEETSLQIWYKDRIKDLRTVFSNPTVFNMKGILDELVPTQTKLMQSMRFIRNIDESGALTFSSEMGSLLSEEEIASKREVDRMIRFIEDDKYFNDVYDNELIINAEKSEYPGRFLSDALIETSKQKPQNEGNHIETDDVFTEDF